MSTVSLKWTLPTVRVDGSALAPTDIANVDVYDDGSATPTTPIKTLGAETTFTTDVLSVGSHNFSVVIRDTTGHSSDKSNVFTATISATLANPAAVTDLTGTVNP